MTHPNVKSSKKGAPKKSKKPKKNQKEEKRKKKVKLCCIYIFHASIFLYFLSAIVYFLHSPTKIFIRLQYGCIYQLLPTLEKKELIFEFSKFFRTKTPNIATIKRLIFGGKRKINYNLCYTAGIICVCVCK